MYIFVFIIRPLEVLYSRAIGFDIYIYIHMDMCNRSTDRFKEVLLYIYKVKPL